MGAIPSWEGDVPDDWGTVGHPPTGRVAPRLRSRRRRGPGAWLYRGRLADLCRLTVAEVHSALGRLGRESSTGYGSDCESPGPDESPKLHGSLLSIRECYRRRANFVPNREVMLDGVFRGPLADGRQTFTENDCRRYAFPPRVLRPPPD